MTRLITPWIDRIEAELSQYDRELERILDMDLFSLAAKAAGGTPQALSAALTRRRGAVIPITAGQGTIPSFVQSVSAILNHLGLETQISTLPDVGGIEEAIRGGASILFMADDQRYMALDIHTGTLAENDRSTALGYVVGLEAMAGDLSQCTVLVMGCGSVGALAVSFLEEKGAKIALYDKEKHRAKALAKEKHVVLETKEQISIYPYIFDATNEGGWLSVADLHPEVCIAAPGVPLSLDEHARQACHGRLFHDPLQTGTAVMLAISLQVSQATHSS